MPPPVTTGLDVVSSFDPCEYDLWKTVCTAVRMLETAKYVGPLRQQSTLETKLLLAEIKW